MMNFWPNSDPGLPVSTQTQPVAMTGGPVLNFQTTNTAPRSPNCVSRFFNRRPQCPMSCDNPHYGLSFFLFSSMAGMCTGLLSTTFGSLIIKQGMQAIEEAVEAGMLGGLVLHSSASAAYLVLCDVLKLPIESEVAIAIWLAISSGCSIASGPIGQAIIDSSADLGASAIESLTGASVLSGVAGAGYAAWCGIKAYCNR